MARQDHEAREDGVWFPSEKRAKNYADLYDKDPVPEGGGWLAKNRTTNSTPLPTKDGDVVILHRHQLYRVWLANWGGAQGPDPNVAPQDFWNADQAAEAAQLWAEETGGQVFRLQNDGTWTTA